jgi:hypothetical protein
MNSEFQETRTEVIRRHLQEMLRKTRCSEQTFCQRVVEEYHARVAPEARVVDFRTEGDVYHRVVINTQKIMRWFDNGVQVRLPVDLEEACVYALAGKYTEECMAELAKRYGFLPPSRRAAVDGPAAQAAACIAADAGAVLSSLAVMLVDGRITEEDRPHIPEALTKIDQLIADATGVRMKLRAVLGAEESPRLVRG